MASQRTLNELIFTLESGLDRAELPEWVACTILADEDGYALLKDLKAVQAAHTVKCSVCGYEPEMCPMCCQRDSFKRV